jgi:hypothetical protein
VQTTWLAEQRLASPDQGEPLRSVELARENGQLSLGFQDPLDGEVAIAFNAGPLRVAGITNL